ncbi:MAG: hypothetical protein KJ043_12745 [Anaerolineae bacterium]|nr:hypothetical protein [Anaerolineae bacterium]
MRPEIIELQKFDIFPTEEDVTSEELQIIQSILEKISEPITDEEACVLIRLFHPSGDSLFGLSWLLLHLVETAPSHVQNLQETTSSDNYWINFMMQRARNAGWIIE